MSKGKTEFHFTVNADPTLVEAVIRNYLYANKFAQQPREGANYYFFNDPMIKGMRSLEYYINGNEVKILAYVGTFEKPHTLEGFVGAVQKQSYRNDLNPLFEELKKLENASPQAVEAAAAMGQANPYDVNTPVQNDSLNTFMEQNDRKKETQTIIGFVVSLVGLLLSCFGFTYGVILWILEFYFAIQGLKTKKKGLAIATIVIACASIVIFIGEIIVYALFA